MRSHIQCMFYMRRFFFWPSIYYNDHLCPESLADRVSYNLAQISFRSNILHLTQFRVRTANAYFQSHCQACVHRMIIKPMFSICKQVLLKLYGQYDASSVEKICEKMPTYIRATRKFPKMKKKNNRHMNFSVIVVPSH